ncbi:hypothetical protein J3459_017156 [Metarhizium acridum]|nr:hypothetical protein J3459_017156 [Metarhizium acridum]
MRYTRNAQMWILTGLPLVLLRQGLMIHLVNMGNGQHGAEVTLIVSKVLSGIFRAFFQTAGQVSVQAAVSQQELATITALFQAGNSVGGAIGTGVSGAIWRNTLPDKILEYLPDGEEQNATGIFQSIVVEERHKPGTPARDYRESQRILGIVATCLRVPNLMLMWFMKDVELDKEEKKDQENRSRAMTKLERKDDQEATHAVNKTG